MIDKLANVLREMLEGMSYGEVSLTLKVQDSRIVFVEKARIDREKLDDPPLAEEV